MTKCTDDPVSARQCRQVDWTPMLQTLLISPQHLAWQPPAQRPQAGPEWARVQGQLVFRALIEINPDTPAWSTASHIVHPDTRLSRVSHLGRAQRIHHKTVITPHTLWSWPYIAAVASLKYKEIEANAVVINLQIMISGILKILYYQGNKETRIKIKSML